MTYRTFSVKVSGFLAASDPDTFDSDSMLGRMVTLQRQFYAEGLGCPIDRDYPGFVSFKLGDGSSELGLYTWEALALDAGVGTIVRPAEAAQWGGYFGYFADPDGHLWKVAASS